MHQDSDSKGDRPPDHTPDHTPDNNPFDPHILKKRMNLELEAISVNQLNDLANQAVEQNLISAHGYRGGQYELLQQGEFIVLSPLDAIQYLQTLLEKS